MFSISDNDCYSYKLFLIVLPGLFKTCTKSTTEPPHANIQIDNFEYDLVEARDMQPIRMNMQLKGFAPYVFLN